MLSAILVDDESHCLDTLEWQLEEYCPDVEVVARCNSGMEAIDRITELKPQLVFLDIEMPGMNAFEMLEQLQHAHSGSTDRRALPFEIVFTTAYDQYAVHAFKIAAVDYLLKPIDERELQRSVAKVREHQSVLNADQLRLLNERLTQPQRTPGRLALPTSDGLELVEVDKILYCASESNYCHIHLADREYFITRTLKEIQETLEGSSFFRIHNRFLINLNHLSKDVRGEGGYVVMKNGQQLPVARSRKEELLQLIRQL
jgi:two-component system LytT family response regulator